MTSVSSDLIFSFPTCPLSLSHTDPSSILQGFYCPWGLCGLYSPCLECRSMACPLISLHCHLPRDGFTDHPEEPHLHHLYPFILFNFLPSPYYLKSYFHALTYFLSVLILVSYCCVTNYYKRGDLNNTNLP